MNKRTGEGFKIECTCSAFRVDLVPNVVRSVPVKTAKRMSAVSIWRLRASRWLE